MAFAVAIIVAGLLTGCSGAKLKKCPTVFVSDSVMLCKDAVQGLYRMCEKPVDLYQCEDPQ
jgi:hypothetical protein